MPGTAWSFCTPVVPTDPLSGQRVPGDHIGENRMLRFRQVVPHLPDQSETRALDVIGDVLAARMENERIGLAMDYERFRPDAPRPGPQVARIDDSCQLA